MAWGTLPRRQRHTAIHLRLLDVLSSGIAAHPQRFVVVDHDVSCPTGSLQGEKSKSGVYSHSLVVLGMEQQGQAAYPLQRPGHPTASRKQLSATPCPAPQHRARTSATYSPSWGDPLLLTHRRPAGGTPTRPGRGKGSPLPAPLPAGLPRGLSRGPGGPAGGRSPLRCLAAGAD